MGRPGFRRVLLAVADAYKNKRDDLERAAESLVRGRGESGNFRGRASGV